MPYKYQKLILLFLFMLISFILNYSKTYCQTGTTNQGTLKNITGIYNSPKQDDNKSTSEAITLNLDSTFSYIISTEFTKIRANGYWRLSGSNLILNSGDKREKINIKERTNPGSKIKFYVTYKNNDPLYYQLYLITNKDTLHVRDVFCDTLINRTEPVLKAFYIIDTRGFKYPTYFLKNYKSNFFRVQLEKDRIFDNECWSIINDKLQSIGLDGTKMKYYLFKK